VHPCRNPTGFHRCVEASIEQCTGPIRGGWRTGLCGLLVFGGDPVVDEGVGDGVVGDESLEDNGADKVYKVVLGDGGVGV